MRVLVEGVFFILFRGESSFGKMSNYLDDVNYSIRMMFLMTSFFSASRFIQYGILFYVTS